MGDGRASAVSSFVFRTRRGPGTLPLSQDPSRFRTAIRTMSQETLCCDSPASSSATQVEDYFYGSQVKTLGSDISTAVVPQKRSWKDWVRKGIGSGKSQVTPVKTDVIHLFPGWAARRYAEGGVEGSPRPFDVEAVVNGFAISHRLPQNTTRSQRAFIRLAKGFVSLPKAEDKDDISGNTTSRSNTSTSREETSEINISLCLNEAKMDGEIEALEREYQRATGQLDSPLSSPMDLSPPYTPEYADRTRYCGMPAEALRRLHANVESRLQPFWSPVLPNRTVRLYLFATTPDHHSIAQHITGRHIYYISPLATQDVITGNSGSFQARFKVNWEDLHPHFGAHGIPLNNPTKEPSLTIVAKLLPLSATSALPQERSNSEPLMQTSFTVQIPITHCPIRVISDIDDTVKLSNITSGARTVFHNVFVKDLRDCVIPGMKEWYGNLFIRGIRFHYVSNAPDKLLPVIKDFFQISQLPPGSINMKSYSGRSLFTGLLSRPATRKRAGLIGIMDAFPESKFLLIGDSGEQDLKLYADISRERSDRVLGVFIRDVDAGYALDATMITVRIRSQSITTAFRPDFSRLKRILPESLVSFVSSRHKKPPAYPLDLAVHVNSVPSQLPAGVGLSNEEGSRGDLCSTETPRTIRATPSRSESKSSSTSKLPSLQARVQWARSRIPEQIPLRIFREPEECFEVVNEVLEKQDRHGDISRGSG